MQTGRLIRRMLYVIPIVTGAAIAGAWMARAHTGHGREIVGSLWTVGFMFAAFGGIALVGQLFGRIWPSHAATADQRDGGTRTTHADHVARTWRVPAITLAAFVLPMVLLVVGVRHATGPTMEQTLRGAFGMLFIMAFHQLVELVLTVIPARWLEEKDARVSIRPKTRRAPSLGKAPQGVRGGGRRPAASP